MNPKKIYILGICGTFTASVAKLAKDMGFEVAGCDLGVYPPMSEVLKQIKIDIDLGYQLTHILNREIDYFIIGNVITRGNPIMEHILEHKLPYISASCWIKENALKNRKVIAVSGTHGKTTTSAMITHILKSNSIDCGYLIAGKVLDFQFSADLGNHEIFVIEADEYDSAFFEKYPKFMHYHPDVLLINNLEFDHADIYQNLAEIQTHFHYLIRTLPKNAKLIMPKDNEAILEVLNRGFYSEKITWHGVGSKENEFQQKSHPQLNYQITDEMASEVEFTYYDNNGQIHSKKLKWQKTTHASKHNAENAASALCAVLQVGLSLDKSVSALSSFQGVARRMEQIFSNSNLMIYSDFAHHPTAIKTSLNALRMHYPNKKILAIFDPASNTMKKGVHSNAVLADAFEAVDFVHFFQPANAKINTEQIANLCANEASSFKSVEMIVNQVMNNLTDFDVIVLLSNGGFGGLEGKLIGAIKSNPKSIAS